MFPPLDGKQLEDFKRDIAEHGLLDPITRFENKVLDGVHRERVCHELGIEPRYVEFTGDDPIAFVTSRNLLRRHLTFAQRADLALKLLPQYEAEAKKRQGTRTDLTPDPAESSKRAPEAIERAAQAVGLGKTTVREAKRIKKQDPNLWKDVVAGKHTVDAAARRLRNQGQKPTGVKRSPNWNGKTNPTRERELEGRKRKAKGDYVELLKLQLDITRMCRILEGWHLHEYAFNEESAWLMADIHDDLITLGEWHDRSLSAVQAWLLDVDVRSKIDKLRDTTGRTPEEADTARRLADRLERKLEARLMA
jgi:ParB-like chromosome segregation protein Spo0J